MRQIEKFSFNWKNLNAKEIQRERRKEKYLIIFFTAMGFDKIILLHPNKRNESDLPILPNHIKMKEIRVF